MRLLKSLSLASSLLISVSLPAFAAVTVYTPVNGSTVSSPFTLYTVAASCSNQPVTAMGYSFDSSAQTWIYSGTQMDGPVTVAAGGHTLHVKAWGNAGAVCDTDVAITVGAASDTVPATALFNSDLQAIAQWNAVHDAGTIGTSAGWTGTQTSPSRSGSSREFYSTYTDYGGERYTMRFGDDETAQNFFYDTWVYIASNNAGIANIEMDLNQTMPNGQTVIYGFQCDGWSGTWDYTANKGTPTSPNDQWVHSSQGCNPKSWGLNQWHHVQIQYSRDTVGNVFYNYVMFDGAQQWIGAKVLSAFALGWGPTLITNFQVDGANAAGSSTIYLDDTVVYRW
jgi:hypothetical protein